MCGWDMVHVALRWWIGDGLTRGWQHADGGLAESTPYSTSSLNNGWKIGPGSADWSRIGIGLEDWNWIGGNEGE